VSVEQLWVIGIVHPGPEISQIAYIQHHDRTYEVVCPWCAQTLGTLAASTSSLTIMQELATLQQFAFYYGLSLFATFQLGRRKARYPAARFLTPPVEHRTCGRVGGGVSNLLIWYSLFEAACY
jgi:hypothetical protein